MTPQLDKQRKYKLTIASFCTSTAMALSGLLGSEYVLVSGPQYLGFVLLLLGIYKTANVIEKKDKG